MDKAVFVNDPPFSSLPKPFPLLVLPVELRLKIYGFALFPSCDHPPNTLVISRIPYNYARFHRQKTLLRVNKQIRNEATPLIYNAITFRIDLWFPHPPVGPARRFPAHHARAEAAPDDAQAKSVIESTRRAEFGALVHPSLLKCLGERDTVTIQYAIWMENEDEHPARPTWVEGLLSECLEVLAPHSTAPTSDFPGAVEDGVGDRARSEGTLRLGVPLAGEDLHLSWRRNCMGSESVGAAVAGPQGEVGRVRKLVQDEGKIRTEELKVMVWKR